MLSKLFFFLPELWREEREGGRKEEGKGGEGVGRLRGNEKGRRERERERGRERERERER